MTAQAGTVEGQSASAAHWVHLPFAQTDATATPVEPGWGQSPEVVHAVPVPLGDVGSTGQLDEPHQSGQNELWHIPGGIGET